MKNSKVQKLTLSALFISMAYVLPFLTGQIQEIGSMLSPMHIPVILCGFVCGGPYGFAVGLISPLLRSLILGMPPILTAVAMSFELATYGFVAGILYQKLPKKKMSIYISLIISMLSGRLIWGLARCVLMGLGAVEFSFKMFLAGAFADAVPGIILQIILIPVIVMALDKHKISIRN